MRKDYSEQTMMEQQLDRRLQEESEQKLPLKLRWQTLGHYAKAFLVYALVCVVLCIGAANLLHSGLEKKVRGYVNDAGAETVAQTRATVGALLANTYTETQQAAESGAVHEAILAENATGLQQEELLSYFDSRFADTACVDSIYVLNRTTDTVYSSNGITSNAGGFFDRAGITQFTTAEQSQKVISRQAEFTLFNQKYLRRYLTMALPLASDEGTLLGGIVVNVDEEKLMSLLQASSEQKECLYIVDAKGNVLAHTDSSVIGTTLSDSVMRRLAAADEAHIRFTDTVNKTNCLVNAEYMPTLDVYIVSAYPVSAVSAGATALCMAIVPLLLVVLLVGYLLANWAALSAARHTRVTRAALSSLSARELASWGMPQSRLLSDVKEGIAQEEARTGAKRSEIVLGWVQGAYVNEEVCAAQLRRCGIQFTQPEFLGVVIRLDDLANLRRTRTPRTIYLMKRAIMKSAQDVFSQRCTVAASANAEDHVVLMLNCAAQDDIRWVRTALKNLQSDFFAQMNVQLSCGIGDYRQGLLNASASYRNALRAVAYRLMQGRECIISYDEIAGRESRISDYPSREALAILHGKTAAEKCTAVDAFIRLLAEGSAESAGAAMQRLTSAMAAEGSTESLRAAALLRDAETLRAWQDILLAYANDSMSHLRMATAHAEDIITVSEQASEEGRSVMAVLKARLQKKDKPKAAAPAKPRADLASVFTTTEKKVETVAAATVAAKAGSALAGQETVPAAGEAQAARPAEKAEPIVAETAATEPAEETRATVANGFAEMDVTEDDAEANAQETEAAAAAEDAAAVNAAPAQQAEAEDAPVQETTAPEAEAPAQEEAQATPAPQAAAETAKPEKPAEKKSFFSFLKKLGAGDAPAETAKAKEPISVLQPETVAEPAEPAEQPMAEQPAQAPQEGGLGDADLAKTAPAAKEPAAVKPKKATAQNGKTGGKNSGKAKTVTAQKRAPAAEQPAKDETVQRACRYIEEHKSDAALSVDAIAAELALSPGYFRTMFKKEMGVTPTEYIVKMRLDIAKKMLVETDLSGKEIADSIGYEFRYFYSLFKNRTGMTAKEYRSQYGKGGTETE